MYQLPAIFCRLMSLVLKGLTCCLAYIDDTVCFSSSFDDHLRDLDLVLDRFRQANLKLKASKCKLFQTQCKFVGHIVSIDGIKVDPSKVACVVNWPFPRTISELRGFLGLPSYYRYFCPGYARVADPSQSVSVETLHCLVRLSVKLHSTNSSRC